MKESFRVHMKTISHGAHIISKKLVFFQKGLYFSAYYDIMCLFLSKREFRRDFRDFRDFEISEDNTSGTAPVFQERVIHMTYEEALTYLTAHGQQHLLRYYPTLTPAQQKHLLEQISNLHLERPQFQNREAAAQQRGHFAPLGAVTLEQIAEKADEYRRIGLQAIRDAKVGAVLLAGGQGSRLGFDHPKGMYNMGKTRDLYIFECLIHNLKKVTDEAEAYVPLMIMTSEQNDAETRAFLKEHDYFGYSADNVHFFKQETEPAVDENGKIFLNAPDQIVLSPNGNGGWFSSIQRAGLLQTVEEIGLEWLNVFAVDNVLQQIADPVFIGATIASGCASGGKGRQQGRSGRTGGCALSGGQQTLNRGILRNDRRNADTAERGRLAGVSVRRDFELPVPRRCSDAYAGLGFPAAHRTQKDLSPQRSRRAGEAGGTQWLQVRNAGAGYGAHAGQLSGV